MNYGGIGSIIGREITHGFDDQGRQYDKNGNVGEWWTLETKEMFTKRTDCIVDQFESHIKQVAGFSVSIRKYTYVELSLEILSA